MAVVQVQRISRAGKPRYRRAVPVPDDVVFVCELMETAVAAAFVVSVDDLRAPSRGTAAAAFARQCAMYLAHVAFGLSYNDAGALFDRDRTTAAYACRLVEARRDNPAVDRLLELLETLCGDIAGFLGAKLWVRS